MRVTQELVFRIDLARLGYRGLQMACRMYAKQTLVANSTVVTLFGIASEVEVFQQTVVIAIIDDYLQSYMYIQFVIMGACCTAPPKNPSPRSSKKQPNLQAVYTVYATLWRKLAYIVSPLRHWSA